MPKQKVSVSSRKGAGSPSRRTSTANGGPGFPCNILIPRIMGIINVTPDSFYAGSRAAAFEEAVRCGLEMAKEGADLLDVGGESTRPGALPVSEEEECRRVLPVIESLSRKVGVPISVDTSKAGVASKARKAGATVLNDVTALRGDPGMAAVARKYPRVILMHMQGEPRTMQENPRYADVVQDILSFFRERLDVFTRAGGKISQLMIDPGIGFGKNLEHNLDILGRLEELRSLGRPIVLGASRKSFIGRILGGEETPLPAEDRLQGSLAVACRAALAGVDILRVHDVRATRQTLEVFGAIKGRGPKA